MFREYFLSFTTSKITEEVELTKKAASKTSAILCGHCNNRLHAANLYSRTIKPSNKTCVFQRFRIKLDIYIKCKIYVNT